MFSITNQDAQSFLEHLLPLFLSNKRYLVEHCLTQVKTSEAEDCWLEVQKSNQAAISLYESLGFQTVEVRKNYYQNPSVVGKPASREDTIIMCWRNQ